MLDNKRRGFIYQYKCSHQLILKMITANVKSVSFNLKADLKLNDSLINKQLNIKLPFYCLDMTNTSNFTYLRYRIYTDDLFYIKIIKLFK